MPHRFNIKMGYHFLLADVLTPYQRGLSPLEIIMGIHLLKWGNQNYLTILVPTKKTSAAPLPAPTKKLK
jgi:hypothetical protein